MKRTALYARVSTDDRGQDPETQLAQLREFADRRGFEIAGEYVDHASGRKNDRPRYQEMLAAARKRQIDVVMVWSGATTALPDPCRSSSTPSTSSAPSGWTS